MEESGCDFMTMEMNQEKESLLPKERAAVHSLGFSLRSPRSFYKPLMSQSPHSDLLVSLTPLRPSGMTGLGAAWLQGFGEAPQRTLEAKGEKSWPCEESPVVLGVKGRGGGLMTGATVHSPLRDGGSGRWLKIF